MTELTAKSERLLSRKMQLGWSIDLPEVWQQEAGNGAEVVFYQEQSDIVIRITPFQIEKEGQLLPVHIMKDAFNRTIPAQAKSKIIPHFSFEGYETQAFECTEEQGRVFRVGAAIYCAGYLASINVFATNKVELEQSLQYLTTIKHKLD